MKLTLTEACLMEASGELGGKARARLLEHVQKYPAALLEYEIARGNLALLKMLPKVEISDDEKLALASNIKVGVQRKIWARRHEEQAQQRWKRVYKALAWSSAAAAAVVIAASITFVQVQENQQRVAIARAQLNRTEQVLDSYMAADQPSGIDSDINSVSKGLEALDKDTVAVAPENPSPFEPVIFDINITPQDLQEFTPPTGG